MRIRIAACCCVVAAGLAGCVSRGPSRSFGTLRQVHNDVVAETSDVLYATRQQVSRTLSGMLHDWNYVNEEDFADYRQAAGQ